MTKQDKRSLKSVAAIAIALFYIVNVQSVNAEVPKEMARQDELETRYEVKPHAT
jgi:hypothetical protein